MSRRLIAMNLTVMRTWVRFPLVSSITTPSLPSTWLCTLVGQIRDLTAKQNLMLQQAAEAVELRSIRTRMTLPSPSSRSRRR